ncbi:MAG: ABC transporter substrate-binding protein [Actinobacteria bacterium 13_2_20CM_2_71_6]|nr:MAG: ABC transporter substrate-binding protein [Actinobacteria bacterium 13_2_20CM_2_71_6]
MFKRRTAVVAAGIALVALAAAGCNRGSSSGGSGASGGASGGSGGKVGIDQPRSDSDFWNSYAKYVDSGVKDMGIDALPPTNSQNDITKLAANVKTLVAQGAKAIVMAPQDTAAVANTLDDLASKNIPVVSVDTRPDQGKVYMVVRADNKAYGQKACEFLGKQLNGKGTVVEFEGDLASINGRDRSEAFGSCMKDKFPGIKVLAEETNWKGDVASAKLQNDLNQGAVNGIYMQAGGVFLAPTIALLSQKGLLVAPDNPKHVFIVSNDGIPGEFDAIRKGQIDATVSQPADLYAKYALFYAKAALAGQKFQAGPTDHQSTIVTIPNGFEDQLPAPLVTKDNVDDKSLWGNQVGK